MMAKVLAKLSAGQRSKWAELAGKEFKMPAFQPGRRGQGGPDGPPPPPEDGGGNR